jgi:hypothetical protein
MNRQNPAIAGLKTTLWGAWACRTPRIAPKFLDNKNSVFGSGALA